ncbi:unnamed protein product [Rhizophagus irregularis]|uniref:Uncharacterized protein n=1 Tax=Rhizophagus irregularis TaxID=588596 RepID=A0A916EKE0_9GLOM|nr:hypothetical protein GLOIN_2v956250 [Rhizophagus irregularis DAOM 181602=DAOM 197198]CAB4484007.1 unnamed protein product [Rhizophagus irregularis]CAB5200959.1 unnamed protein product [Rhizophagus irregularis]CAB5394159.1 unnamed protein product [Rhizophagus irregularis]
MSLTQKPETLKQSNLSDLSIPFSVLPSPFQTVLVINATQHQHAIQKVAEIDQEVRNAGVNLTLIAEVTKEEKIEYSNLMADLIPLYAKINRLIPLHYIISKNSDAATRNLIAMKYLIQQQFIALPDEHYFLTVDELQKHKNLLQELEKYEHALEKLQNSGGYAACSIQFLSKQEGSLSHNNLSEEVSDIEHSLPPLKSGTGALAKFLTLVENDSLDDLSNRVGDLLTPTMNNIRQIGNLNRNQTKNHLSPNTNNEIDKWKEEFALWKEFHNQPAKKYQFYYTKNLELFLRTFKRGRVSTIINSI